jgi:hypothetical protein
VCRGEILGVLIPLASPHLLDRPAQFVVEGATRLGIVAEAIELDLDALGFRIWSV